MIEEATTMVTQGAKLYFLYSPIITLVCKSLKENYNELLSSDSRHIDYIENTIVTNDYLQPVRF